MPKQIPFDIAEKLITAIQKRECLYNSRHAEYRNRHVSELAWKDVADEIQRNVVFCKSTWATLRCTFNRNLARKTRRGSEAIKQPKWHFYKRMMFLKDHVSHGHTVGNLQETGNTTDSESSSNTCNDNKQYEQVIYLDLADDSHSLHSVNMTMLDSSAEPLLPPKEETEPSSTNCSNTTYSTFANIPSTADRKKKSPAEDPVQHPVVDFISPKKEQSDDEDLNFFKSLLPYFRTLPPAKKLKFMHYATGYMMELNAECE